jgi:M6 family metalloprotease-like protein
VRKNTVRPWRYAILFAACVALLAGDGVTATLSDFAKPYAGVKPIKGSVPLLVILLRPDDPAHMPNQTQADIRNLIFGPRKSVRTYFNEVSYGWFSFKEAMVTPWLVARDDPSTSDWNESTAAFIHTSDIHRKGAWVIRQVEQLTNFRFADYDLNGDGRVTERELAVLWLYPGGGAARGRSTAPAVVKVPSLSVGVEIGMLVRGGDQQSWATIAHELAHQVLRLGDLYVDRGGYVGVGRASLMCDQAQGTHLDPWAKMKLGWLAPQVVTEDGWYSLTDVETQGAGSALILHDPQRGASEYFILENRWPGNSHEDFLSIQGLQGLALWRISEDGAGGGNWARNTIELVWAAGPPPAAALVPDTCPSRNDALFDGAASATAYAPMPNWRDGTSSNIAIWHIPRASGLARVYVDVPPRQQTSLVGRAVALAGTSADLDRYRNPYAFVTAQGRNPSDIVGMGIASDDRVYVWYRDGWVSAGSSGNLAAYRAPYRYRLPSGRTPADIVGMGIANDDHVYAWYRDGTVSSGTTLDLEAYRPPYAFTLPPGYRPSDIVALGIASDDHVYAWYRDGMVTSGTSADLDRYRSPYRYTLPIGRVPSDILGMGIAADDHVYTWLDQRGTGAPIILTAHSTPAGVEAGKAVVLTLKTANQHGQPMAGVRVIVESTGGRFLGPNSGTTDARGLLELNWQAPNRAPAAYGQRILLEARGQRAGFAEGRFLIDVPIIRPGQIE